MTPTQSQIRDALATLKQCEDYLNEHLHRSDTARDEYPKDFKTIRTILQSALDTQKPAGDNIKLSGDDAIAFTEVITNSPEPNDALRKAASEYLKTTGEDAWRPISEAPRDSNAFVALDRSNYDAALVRFDGDKQDFREYNSDTWIGIDDYTHWMPLPPAPRGEE